MEKDYTALQKNETACPIAPRDLVIKRIMAFSKAYEDQKVSEEDILDRLKN